MKRTAFTLVAIGSALAFAGCASEQPNLVKAPSSGMQTAQMAAYSAKAQYPTGANPSSTLRASAVVHKDSGQIDVVNYTDKPIDNVDVWVNGGFVSHIDSIPANGKVMIARGAFFNRTGHSLSDLPGTTVQRVEIEQNGQLYQLLGPIGEAK